MEEKSTAPPKCAAGCGFFGNPACENFCSKCYRDREARKEAALPTTKSPQEPAHKPTTTATATATVEEVEVSSSSSSSPTVTANATTAVVAVPKVPSSPSTPRKKGKKKKKTRCHVCNSKLGLMSFDCKCEGFFCTKHRFPDQHECPFDFKTLERKKLEMANPVVSPPKLNRL